MFQPATDGCCCQRPAADHNGMTCACRLRAAVRRAWRPRHTCCCVLLLLLLIAVMLAIILPVKLVQKPVPLPPSFTTHPQVLSATSSSIDVTLGVSEPTVVRYVLIPRAAGRRLQQTADSWKQYSSIAIAAAAAGWGSTALEVGTCLLTTIHQVPSSWFC